MKKFNMMKIKNNQYSYLLFLDATKVFDRVCYGLLFNVLLDDKVCPVLYNCYVMCISIMLAV